jgi:hypothetical protein
MASSRAASASCSTKAGDACLRTAPSASATCPSTTSAESTRACAAQPFLARLQGRERHGCGLARREHIVQRRPVLALQRGERRGAALRLVQGDRIVRDTFTVSAQCRPDLVHPADRVRQSIRESVERGVEPRGSVQRRLGLSEPIGARAVSLEVIERD